MIGACKPRELFLLYAFSIYYVLKEWINILFGDFSLSGKKLIKCTGCTAVVTGGTSGIGLETVKLLLSCGVKVIIGSNVASDQSEKCLRELRRNFPQSKVEIWYVDMSSMDSVKDFSIRFLESGLPLHLLINNAGIMFAPYVTTKDNFESHLAINYLSHCLLTKLLLPCLKQSSIKNFKSRIVNVSSCLHRLGEDNLKIFENQSSHCPHEFYIQSKLYQVAFTSSLSRFLVSGDCPILANVLHPGVCYTKLYKHVWWAPILRPFLQSAKKGAETIVYTALSTDLLESNGFYIEGCQCVKPQENSQNQEFQTRLWNKTWQTLQPWLDD